MSLLLDALKRAEQEKLARGDRIEHDEAAAPGRSAAALELQPIHGAGNPRPDPAQAQAVFKAKTGSREKPQGHGVLWATLGAIIVVVAAAGAYVWYSLRSLAPLQQPLAVRPPPPAPTPAPASLAPAPATYSPPNVTPPAEAAGSDPADDKPRAAAGTAAKPAESLAAQIADAETPVRAPAPLKLAPSREPPRVPADIAAGYDALRAGDLATARRRYVAAAAVDARSVDVQLGLATVEARVGNAAAAATHYRRALELDPRNGSALAGLAALADASQADAIEGRLREDLGRTPQSAALHFSLGNVYAAQGRWNDAQTAFFEAYRLEPGNADMAHNLAVSLDRLGKARLAADYYRRALELRGGGAQFEPAAVERRLAELARAAER